VNKTNKVIIFDGDDTLWRTQELYNRAKNRFIKLMEVEGFDTNNIIDLKDNIDAQRVEILKFSKTRFMESLLITYAFLCGKYNKNWNIKVESKIREIGLSVFRPPKLYKDTIRTLKNLKKFFKLVLFTEGEKEIQIYKIQSLGSKFKSYFYKIYICEMKEEEKLLKILNDLCVPREKVWIVGNSVRSDINPALRLGLKAILINRKTWKYEDEKLLEGNVFIVNSVKEAAKIILKKGKNGIK